MAFINDNESRITSASVKFKIIHKIKKIFLNLTIRSDLLKNSDQPKIVHKLVGADIKLSLKNKI